jgi:hypothetical protein
MKRLAKMKKTVMLAMLAVVMVTAVGCHWSDRGHGWRDRDYYDRWDRYDRRR